jgi:endonuclease/exonuclease/phosphatase family metal-dependent hydrolase
MSGMTPPAIYLKFAAMAAQSRIVPPALRLRRRPHRPPGPTSPGFAQAAMLAAMLVATLAAGIGIASAAGRTLKLATWNLEWLVTPATFTALEGHCTPAGEPHRFARRSMPCDVAAELGRSATDLASLARYARELDADVIAIQEVDGAEAARQVFPGHEFCFTGGHALQNTGFAIRRGTPYRCEGDLMALSLGDTVRRGARLVLYPGTPQELHLLAVHLKSGCSRHPLDSGERACERLAQQAPALREWLLAQQRAGHAYAVLGDFNRDLLAEAEVERGSTAAQGLWAQLNAGGPGPGLRNTAAGQPFHNCYAGQTHTGYIDYILLGAALQGRLVSGSFERLTYSASDAWHRKLSDHCPVAVKVQVD